MTGNTLIIQNKTTKNKTFSNKAERWLAIGVPAHTKLDKDEGALDDEGFVICGGRDKRGTVWRLPKIWRKKDRNLEISEI